MSFILKKKTVQVCSILGVVTAVLILFLTIHFRDYALYSENIVTNGKTGLEKKLENYISENKFDELEKEKESLSKILLMRQGKPESPEKIQLKPIKTEVLSKNKDLDYSPYTYEHMGKKRIITYLNINSESHSFYRMLYPTIDCLGKTFVSTFEGETPKSKNECENEVKSAYASIAQIQRKTIEKINNIDEHINNTIKPLKDELKANGGYEKKWMAGPTYNTCSEHIAMASDESPGVFKTKSECIDDISMKIKLIDEKNQMRGNALLTIRLAKILSLLLFIPLFLKLSLLFFKKTWSLWLLFLEKSFESANRYEKKIKINAEIQLKEKKDKE